jgi:transposase
MPQNIIGVDVAKDWIDAYWSASAKAVRIEATRASLKGFARKAAGALVVFEASGGYERPLVDALDAQSVAYVRVNPRQAREFARATGRLAKTDKVDARALAEMGAALSLQPTPQASSQRRRLADLVARREDIVAMIGQEKNRLQQAQDAFIRRDILSLVTVLERRKAKLDHEIADHVEQNEELRMLDARLRSVPGVGPAIAPALIAGLPELGTLDRRKIAALAGLAPHASDSGQRIGKRMIWGGRANVRRALYLAAFIASRCNPELKAYRMRLEEKGKCAKAAIIATARKLLTQINACVKEQRNYELRTSA